MEATERYPECCLAVAFVGCVWDLGEAHAVQGCKGDLQNEPSILSLSHFLLTTATGVLEPIQAVSGHSQGDALNWLPD